AAMEAGARTRHHPGGGCAPGGGILETLVVVVTNGAREEQLIPKVHSIFADEAVLGRVPVLICRRHVDAPVAKLLVLALGVESEGVLGVRNRWRAEEERALIVDLGFRAGGFGGEAIVRIVLAVGAGVADAENLLPAAIEQNQPSLAAAEDLLEFGFIIGVDDQPLGRRRRNVEILPIVLCVGAVVATVQAYGEVVCHLESTARIERAVFVAVLLTAAPGDVDAVAVQQCAAQRAPQSLGAATDTGIEPVSTERPAFGRAMCLETLEAAPRDDVDDAADRIRAPDSALRAAQHLDPFDVVGEEVREVVL